MAYTIEQKPNKLTAANSPMVFVLKESSSAIYNADKFERRLASLSTEIDKLRIELDSLKSDWQK